MVQVMILHLYISFAKCRLSCGDMHGLKTVNRELRPETLMKSFCFCKGTATCEFVDLFRTGTDDNNFVSYLLRDQMSRKAVVLE